MSLTSTQEMCSKTTKPKPRGLPVALSAMTSSASRAAQRPGPPGYGFAVSQLRQRPRHLLSAHICLGSVAIAAITDLMFSNSHAWLCALSEVCRGTCLNLGAPLLAHQLHNSKRPCSTIVYYCMVPATGFAGANFRTTEECLASEAVSPIGLRWLIFRVLDLAAGPNN